MRIFHKGQVSVEFLSILGIALLMVGVGAATFLSQSRTTNHQVLVSKFESNGIKILEKSEELRTLGDNSWTTMEILIPNEIAYANIQNGRDLVFSFNGKDGVSDVVIFFDRFNISNGSADCSVMCNVSFGAGVNFVRVQPNKSTVMIIPT